ncbi:MAG: DUF3592 domain-containing protein [Pirellulaceae bacterium]
MRSLIAQAWSFSKGIVALFVFILFVLLLFFMFCVGPIAIVAETYDLLRFDKQAMGVLTDMETRLGNKGTSGIRITYHFDANGNRFVSNQLYPGFVSNYGTYSGGDSLSRKYTIGNQYRVFFDASDPSFSCLEHGWHKWSIGWTAVVWGMIAICRVKKTPLWIASMTTMLYGFGLIGFGPNTLLVDELHWHLLAIVAIGTSVFLYSVFNRDSHEQNHEREPPMALSPK